VSAKLGKKKKNPIPQKEKEKGGKKERVRTGPKKRRRKEDVTRKIRVVLKNRPYKKGGLYKKNSPWEESRSSQ